MWNTRNRYKSMEFDIDSGAFPQGGGVRLCLTADMIRGMGEDGLHEITEWFLKHEGEIRALGWTSETWEEDYISDESIQIILNGELATDIQRKEARTELDARNERRLKEKRRRAPKRGLRLRVIERDNQRCRYCGDSIKVSEIHIDHVIPYSLGGLTEYGNLVCACKKCNLKKYGRTPEEAGMVLRGIYEHRVDEPRMEQLKA